MIKHLYLLIIVFNVLSCNTDRSKQKMEAPHVETNVSELKESLESREASFEDTQEQIRSVIRKHYAEELKKCSQSVNAVTNFNKKKEFWRICHTEDGKKIIQINSHQGDYLYEEIYFDKNNELIYAIESIKYMPPNHYTLQPWTCEFFTENGELASLMSLGHGKTEDDTWDPDIIFEMFKNRLKELHKIADQ